MRNSIRQTVRNSVEILMAVLVFAAGIGSGFLMLWAAWIFYSFLYHGPTSLAMDGQYGTANLILMIVAVFGVPFLVGLTLLLKLYRVIPLLLTIFSLIALFLIQVILIGFSGQLELLSQAQRNDEQAKFWDSQVGENIARTPKPQKDRAIVGVNLSVMPKPSCGSEIVKAEPQAGDIIFKRAGDLYLWKVNVGEIKLTSVGNVGKFEFNVNKKSMYWLAMRQVDYKYDDGYSSNFETGVGICAGDMASGQTKVLWDNQISDEGWKQQIKSGERRGVFGGFSLALNKLAWVDDGVWLKNLDNDAKPQLIAESTGFTGKNIGELKIYQDINFSPSGGKLLLLASGWEWSLGEVYDVASGKRDQIDNFDGQFNAGRWSWDDKKLFGFTDNRFGSPGVYEMDVVSGKSERIPIFDYDQGLYSIGWVSWNKAGMSAAELSLFGYSSETGNSQTNLGKLIRPEPTIYLVANDQFIPIVQLKSRASELEWSPDDRSLGFIEDKTLKLVDLTGKNISQISDVQSYQWVK